MKALPSTRKEAIENGSIYYDPGKECRNGHISKRYTITGNCYQCMLDATNKNRMEARARMRERTGK